MNISNLIIQLQAKVNNLTYNQLAVAKSIELLETGRVNYANSLSELPSAEVYVGYLYYIRGDGLYYSDSRTWIPITNVYDDGQVWAWGYNGQGRLGDNTTVSKSSPVSIVSGFCDWYQISAGSQFSIALRHNDTIWTWGCNATGQLGDNTTTDRSSPVSAVGGFTNWFKISAGLYHSLGVRTNGTLWAWGCNGQGRLGDNSTVGASSPVSVVGGFTDWCQVSGGGCHSLGVRTSGTSWAWGSNFCGSLGDNTAVSKSSPVSVVGGFVDWCQVAAGTNFSLGVRQNGTLWAWGYNQCGRLGDNTILPKSSPVSVVGGFTDWCQITASTGHALAARQNGTLWGWGINGSGRLGDNSITSRSSPVSVVGGFTDWCQVSTGNDQSLAVRQNGTAWGWGSGQDGKLGNNSTVGASSPVSVVGGFTDWCQISSGTRHSLAIRRIPT